MRCYIGFLAFSFFLSACAGTSYQLPSVSDDDLKLTQNEIASRKTALKIYKRSDVQYRQTVASITRRLIANAKPLCESAEYPGCYFSVTYNSDNTPNAYASEGYKITVYRGLLQYLKNNDEIAAVIGHEMGHHLAHHNDETERNMKVGAAVSGILTAVLLGAANADNPYYNSYQQEQDKKTIENMMDTGAHIGAISYSKEQEREADLLGAYLLARAGYNLERAREMLFLLSHLSGDNDKTRASLTATHPAGPERLVAWRKTMTEIEKNPGKLPYTIASQNIKTPVKK